MRPYTNRGWMFFMSASRNIMMSPCEIYSAFQSASPLPPTESYLLRISESRKNLTPLISAMSFVESVELPSITIISSRRWCLSINGFTVSKTLPRVFSSFNVGIQRLMVSPFSFFSLTSRLMFEKLWHL